MLETLRRGASSWVAKVLLGLLVVSFAIWGVADVFRGYGQGELARVGAKEITLAEFQQAYQRELDLISRQFGRRLTPEQARAFGVDARVLSRLISTAAVDDHARELKLALSDDAVAESIRNDPMFQGPDGKFSRFALENIARQLGVGEQGLIQLRRQDELREQITGALTQGIAIPDELIKLMNDYREEKRTAQHFTIDPAVAVKLPEPDEAKLKETYEANKQQFVTPEYRKLAVLTLSVADLKKRAAVSEDEIKQVYTQEAQRFDVPEKRRILQIAFKNRAEADQAARAIAGGRSFEDVAKEAGTKASDMDLGMLARKDMIDDKIAEAAFALKKNEVSPAVEGRFATVLLKVTEIEPGKHKALSEVQGEIHDQLAEQKVGPELQKLHDQVDDLRAAGKSLQEVAKTVGLPFVEIEATSSAGRTPDGKAALEGPDAQQIIAAAFRGQVGVENDVVELGDGGFAWVDVLSVTEPKQRSFEETAQEVKALWRERETRQQLSELAGKLIERADQGTPLETLAAEVGGKVETAKDFKRIGGAPGLPESAVEQAFTLAKGKAGSAETRDGKSRVIFKVIDIVPAPPPTTADRDRLSADLRRQMEGDVLSEYVAALQDRYGVSVNDAAFRRAIGSDAQQ
jgi:peptidyl-prolyl cis-trans isomerase D